MGAMSPFVWSLVPGYETVIRMMVYAILRSFFIAYILSCLVIITHQQWLKWGIYVITFILFITDSSAILINHIGISPALATFIANTTFEEIKGYFVEYFSARNWIFLSIGIIATCSIILICEHHKKHIMCRFPNTLKGNAVIFIIIAFIISILWTNDIAPAFRCTDPHCIEEWSAEKSFDTAISKHVQIDRGDLLSKLIFTAIDVNIQSKELSSWENELQTAMNHDATCRDKRPLNIIIIFGESFKKDHSQLYGYDKPTNPLLTKEFADSSLVCFNDMISAANFTSGSVKNTMSLNSLGNNESWNSSAFFPIIMKKAGFNIYWFDNQSLYSGESLFSFHQGSYLFNPYLIKNYSINDSIYEYDGDFIKYVATQYEIPNERNFIVYHIMGQHFPAKSRYPENSFADKWSGKDITIQRPWLDDDKRQAIAEYDNSTLYNDSVISSIISAYRTTPAIIFYFSDHGIDMYDDFNVDVRSEKINPGEDPKPWVKRNFEIPFFIWMSDQYRAQYPDKERAVRNSMDKPGMLDNIGQMIFNIGDIESTYYIEERDILSDKYRCPPRITVGGYNYDEIVAGRKTDL